MAPTDRRPEVERMRLGTVAAMVALAAIHAETDLLSLYVDYNGRVRISVNRSNTLAWCQAIADRLGLTNHSRRSGLDGTVWVDEWSGVVAGQLVELVRQEDAS